MFAVRTDLIKHSGLALLGGCSVAIAIPLFATLADGVAFFIAHNTSRGQLLCFTLLVYLGPAIVMLSLIWLAGRIGPKPRAVLTLLCFVALGSLWLLAWLTHWPSTPAALATLLGAVLLCFCVAQSELFLSFLRTLGLISPLVPIAFLWFSPVNSFMQNADGEMFAEDNTEKTALIDAHPIVFVVLDELSLSSIRNAEGNIDAGRLPNFDRLAALSTWYRNATTVSSLTDTAAPALLSGLYAQPDQRAPVHQYYPQNIFTALSASYQMRVTETVTRLCPPELCNASAQAMQGLAPSAESKVAERASSFPALLEDVWVVFWHLVLPNTLADRHLPSLSDRWSGFSKQPNKVSGQQVALWTAKDMGSNTDKNFNSFVRGLSGIQRAQLHYFHLSLPHHPWYRLPSGKPYNGITELGRASSGYAWSEQSELVEQAEIRYLLQLEYVDRLLGEMLDSLQKSSLFDDLMLVVVADHGLTFQPGASVRVPNAESLADIARIPLFVKYPFQTAASVSDLPAQTIDLFPTVLDVLGFEVKRRVDGQSLIAENPSIPTRRIHEGNIKPAQFEQLLTDNGRLGALPRKDGASMLSGGIAQGALQELFGRSAAELSVNGQAKIRGTLLNSHWYEDVNVHSGFLPARLEARFTGLNSNIDVLALLNGRVAGSARSYNKGKDLSLMLSPEYFQQGHNRVQLLTERDGKLMQLPFVNSVKDISWVYQADKEKLQSITVDGQTWRAGQSSDLQGRADLNPKGAGSVNGWAYNFATKKTAKELLLFQGGRLLNSIPRTFALFSFGGDFEEFAQGSQPGFSFPLNRMTPPYRVVALFEHQEFIELSVGNSHQQENVHND